MTGIIEAIGALTNPDKLFQVLAPMFTSGWGYAALSAIVFSETGLLVGFFLPGDSLLFLIGAVAGAGDLDIMTVNIVLMAAAILGDTFGYTLGRRARPRLFKRPAPATFRRAPVWSAPA